MQKRKRFSKWVLMLVFFLIGPSVVQAQDTTPDACMHSFDRFAYEGPRDPEEALHLPLHPWEPVMNVFEELQDVGYYISDVTLARNNNGNSEIWLRSFLQGESIWLLYRPQSSDVEIISAEIQEPNLVVHNLYVDNMGTMWGALLPTTPSATATYPVLGVFNESQRRFELIEDVPEISIESSPVRILQTHNGLFWIVASYDGIYSFDPVTHNIQRRANLPSEELLYYVTMSSGDTLYFSTGLSNPAAPGFASLEQQTMYQFFPQTNELTEVDIPREWPTYRGLLSDSEGRLWLGSVGFLGSDGVWNLLHPNPEYFLEYPLFASRTLPTLLFESSDGRLWYTNWWDGGIWHNGTAWYNPTTGEGCMFTNAFGSIVEDAEHRLWLVANGTVYTSELNSH